MYEFEGAIFKTCQLYNISFKTKSYKGNPKPRPPPANREKLRHRLATSPGACEVTGLNEHCNEALTKCLFTAVQFSSLSNSSLSCFSVFVFYPQYTTLKLPNLKSHGPIKCRTFPLLKPISSSHPYRVYSAHGPANGKSDNCWLLL